MATQYGVKAKKALGQHFLNDESVARRIVDEPTPQAMSNIFNSSLLFKLKVCREIKTNIFFIQCQKKSIIL